MPTLWVYETDASGYPGRDVTPIANAASNGRTMAVPVDSTSRQSDPFLRGTRLVGLQSDVTCWVSFGQNPKASSVSPVRSYDFTSLDELPAGVNFSRSSPAFDYKFKFYEGNAPRLVQGEGLLMDETRTNKCENINTGLSGTEGMSTQGGASVERLGPENIPQDVISAFSEQGFDTSVVRGLFRLTGDNGGQVNISGAAGNTNQHALSAFAYVSSGAAVIGFSDLTSTGPLKTDFERTIHIASAFTGIETFSIGLTAADSEVWFFGNQLEEGSFATAPIVTAGSSETRAQEVCSEAYSRSGAFTVDATAKVLDVPTSARHVWQLSTGSTQNRFRGWFDGTGILEHNSVVASVQTEAVPAGSIAAGQTFRLLSTFDTSNITASLDDGAVTSTPSGGVDTTVIGYGTNEVSGNNPLTGYLRTFDLYNQALTSAQIGDGGVRLGKDDVPRLFGVNGGQMVAVIAE